MLMKQISLTCDNNIVDENKKISENDKYCDRLKEIKTRKFFIAYFIFLEFCKKRKLYRYSELVFIKSCVYDFFMEISDFILKNKVVNGYFFIRYILSMNTSFKEWNTQAFYMKYLEDLIVIEPPEEAFYRSLIFLEKWAENNNVEISKFFKINNENYILFTIENRMLSPWLLYSCKEGRDFLSNTNLDKFPRLKKDLNKARWDLKLELYNNRVEIFENILKEKGL